MFDGSWHALAWQAFKTRVLSDLLNQLSLPMIKKKKDACPQKTKGEIKERCKWVWRDEGLIFLAWEVDIRTEKIICFDIVSFADYLFKHLFNGTHFLNTNFLQNTMKLNCVN